MNKIGFWKVNEPYGEFSNWYMSNFKIFNIDFISSEQALMYCKALYFGDKETASKILEETNNKNIKDLGRQVKNYEDLEWSVMRYPIMSLILYHKFSQNKDLKELLLNTKDALIYEASPLDNIWGIGSTDVNDIKGQNLLGKALMETREKLRTNEKGAIDR